MIYSIFLGISNFARTNTFINVEKDQKYWDYENFELKFGNSKKYEIIRKVGQGKYGNVFEGIDITNNEHRIIKVLKPIKLNKIRREVSVLEKMKDCPFVSPLYDIIKNNDTDTISLILRYVDNVDYKILYQDMDQIEMKFYLSKILLGLEYCHNRGIMHRDIKPHNIMYNPDIDELSIIDWGLAEYYYPGHVYNVRVASRYYKSPELLLNFGV